MIIAQQHQLFKLRVNKVNSLHYEDMLPYQIDAKLDEAAIFICQHYGEFGNFNSTQFNKDLFGNLLVSYPDQPELTNPIISDEKYEYVLDNLKYEYLHLDSAYVKCGKSYIKVALFTGDEKDILNSSYNRPSFKFKRLCGKVAKSSQSQKTSLYIYSDVDLTTKAVRLEYIKYPKKVFFGYYDSLNFIDCKKRESSGFRVEDCNNYYKIGDAPVNSEFSESLADLQVDIAVWLTTGKTENQFLNSFISQKIQALPK